MVVNRLMLPNRIQNAGKNKSAGDHANKKLKTKVTPRPGDAPIDDVMLLFFVSFVLIDLLH